MLIYHIRAFSEIKQYKLEKSTPLPTALMTGMNIIFIVSVSMGFGKPYSIVYASFISFLFLCGVGKWLSGLYDWREKACWFIVNLVLLGDSSTMV